MPFEAAKAVAATFCWRIRHILTPVFGLDFIDMCIHPTDRGRYGRMIIHKSIVNKSTEIANYYRTLDLQSLSPQQPLLTSRHPPDLSKPFEKQILPKSFDHRHLGHRLRHSYADSLVGYGSSPEYTSGASSSDTYCMSPVSPIRNTFTPVNTPRSTDVEMGCSGTSSPRDLLCSLQNMSRKRAIDASDAESGIGGGSGSGSSDATTSSNTFYTSSTTNANTSSDCLSELDDDADADADVDMDVDIDMDDDDDDYRDSSYGDEDPSQSPSKRARASHVETRSRRNRNPKKLLPGEVNAAHALLSLYMQGATGSGSDEEGFMRWQQQQQQISGRKRRRASA